MIDAKVPIGTRVVVAIRSYEPFRATVVGYCRLGTNCIRVRRDGHSRFTNQKVSCHFITSLDESEPISCG